MGRVDVNNLYNVVKNFRWGNFKDLNTHFDETATSNIISYRMSASRAAAALALSGQKTKALEILDLAAKEIPAEKYNDPRSLSSMVTDILLQDRSRKDCSWQKYLKRNF
jgi:hypothetical protein